MRTRAWATTCSFHLRQLARYGFVEEAGGGKGRARPWRVTSTGYSLASVHDDPQAEIASNAVLRLWRERTLGRYQTWLETKATYPRRWREAACDNEYLLYLTADELDQLNEELTDLLLPRSRERITDPSLRPPGAVPVELLTFSYPIGPLRPGSLPTRPAGEQLRYGRCPGQLAHPRGPGPGRPVPGGARHRRPQPRAPGSRERRAALRSRVGFALVEAGLRLAATRPPDHFSP